ncbi:MAG: hypothetical protein J6V53_05105 [Alphaproteobacteria bacterium]|nr:hypothetical protein [Alphaproteobacteria bacterium]
MRYFLIFFFFLFQIFFSFAPTVQAQTDIFVDENIFAERGIFTGRKGLGDYQKTEFGRFRLISCSGGIPKDNILFLMVEALLQKDWKLEKPLIPYSQLDNVLEEKILYPVSSLDEKWFSGYENKAYFSLIYHLKEGTQELAVNKKFPVKACLKDLCKEEFLDLSLSIRNDSLYPTDVCTKMLRQFQLMIKKPKKEEVGAQLNILENNYLQLFVTFKKDVSFLNLQTQKLGNFEIVKKDFKDNQASLLIKTDINLTSDAIPLTLISSLGIFEIEVSPAQNPYVFLGENINWLDVFGAGILLFFLSPLFYLFLSLPDEKNALLEKVKKIQILFGILFLFVAFSFYLYPNLINLMELRGVFVWIMLGILLWLVYYPKYTLQMGIIVFLLFPKPYLTNLILMFSEEGGIWLFGLFFILFILGMLPFMLCKRLPILFSELRKLKQYTVLIRLPQMILLGWLLIAFFGNNSYSKSLPDDIETLKKNNQVVYVSVEDDVCLSCLLNKWSFSYYLNHMTDYKNNDVRILSLNINDERVKNFLRKNKLPLISQGLLWGSEQAYFERMHHFISIEEWYSFFQKVTPQEKIILPALYQE